MGLEIGIVGLPNVGKSTLFNALLKKQQALVANYPFATIEPNVGIVPVPDPRLAILANVVKTEKIVPATVKFVDIAGLVKGASQGEGLGNKFLAHIREVDAVLYLIRDFDDENIIRAGSTNPKDDYEILKLELELGNIVNKPEIVVLNTDEDKLTGEGLRICAKLEEELAALSEEEQKEYLKQLGIEKTGLERVIAAAFDILGLMTFLTAGEIEARAWTIKNGTKAPAAAGVIHTDFAKNFIKADVVNWEDFVKFGGWVGAREVGKVRLEGRDYVMREGDVVEFKVGV
ncbi:MAG: GTP-dependent nucleic acid-binding protein EngD [Candidatus Amesbacteria bacterium GW2011_GWA2_47_11b]|uniref:GTP-dependent nucleic acid-binding protein EngD n=3 Tax=Candidatus Amesiibacteriota TaxID=1752730 RepID=A0A0G1UW17_9BACT|nr:MAG: GTP-dependent nucleic acid-binding protein EngD [Candidatus Amesbacteria bacterium GW2011_GWA2_47_11b]KKU70218.1 MAG: GTP-dependent nucleic acid-binding protein EngD [Candidatus Amesbacteria bacterium GW2011_GWA1_47_20]KKU83249.1 MAG: GTP-dependent nucleic acid-binding protein EngD [Candidatus Amesbacteria bacterium GW2011_GWC2_47_8]